MTLLNRTECSALRGIAIIGIFMHNFIHWLGPMVKENEYLFKQKNVDWLMRVFSNPDENLLWHLFSFFGHYGVPLFVFLSGYGLVLKYEKNTDSTSILEFMKHHFMKLFPMMFLGFVCFAMIDWITPGRHHWEWWHIIAQLTMTINFLPDPDHIIWPGPYWFFGLIMQLYLVYILILHRWRHWGVAASLVILCWAIQATCANAPAGDTLNRIRYNCIGNVMPFCIGIMLARFKGELTTPKTNQQIVAALTLCISIGLILTLSLSFHGWLWVPVFIVTAGIALVKLLPLFCMKAFDWVGALSAAIFVCHPITRKIFIPISHGGHIEDGLMIYVVSTIMLAILFRMVIRQLKKEKA